MGNWKWRKSRRDKSADSYADEVRVSRHSNEPRNRPAGPRLQESAALSQRPSYKYTTIPPAEEKKRYRPTTSPCSSTTLGKEAVRRSPKHFCCGCDRESKQAQGQGQAGRSVSVVLRKVPSWRERRRRCRPEEGRKEAQGRCIVLVLCAGFRERISSSSREDNARTVLRELVEAGAGRENG